MSLLFDPLTLPAGQRKAICLLATADLGRWESFKISILSKAPADQIFYSSFAAWVDGQILLETTVLSGVVGVPVTLPPRPYNRPIQLGVGRDYVSAQRDTMSRPSAGAVRGRPLTIPELLERDRFLWQSPSGGGTYGIARIVGATQEQALTAAACAYLLEQVASVRGGRREAGSPANPRPHRTYRIVDPTAPSRRGITRPRHGTREISAPDPRFDEAGVRGTSWDFQRWKQTRELLGALRNRNRDIGQPSLRVTLDYARAAHELTFRETVQTPDGLPAAILRYNRDLFVRSVGGRHGNSSDGAFFHRVVESESSREGHLVFTGHVGSAISQSHQPSEIARYGSLVESGNFSRVVFHYYGWGPLAFRNRRPGPSPEDEARLRAAGIEIEIHP